MSRISVRAMPPSMRSSNTVVSRAHAIEQLLKIARVERERLRLALVAVHDARNLLRGAQLSRGALSGFRARMRYEDFGCHIDSLGSVIDS